MYMGGTFTVTGGLTIDSGGTLVATGSIVGNVTNYGTLTVGSGTAPGSLSITGNYTQDSAAVLNLVLDGTTAGTGYSQLAISGTATLDGTLNVSLASGYTPSSGNSFQLLTFGSSSGTFASINYPSGPTFTPSYNSGDLTLDVALLTPSDSSPQGQFQEADPEQETLLAGLLGPRQQSQQDTSDALPMPCCTEPSGIMTVSAMILDLPGDRVTETDAVFIELAKRRNRAVESERLLPAEPGDGSTEAVWLAGWTDLLTLPVRLLEELVAIV